jgi:hypothetical protein
MEGIDKVQGKRKKTRPPEGGVAAAANDCREETNVRIKASTTTRL